MPKIEYVFLDFDGTLVNSLPVLYNIYDEFLKIFGFRGDKDEFNKLNGPSIEENVAYLKNKYSIPFSKEYLLQKYNEKIDEIYSEKISPFSESETALKYLKDKNYKLALVSSSKKRYVLNIINKQDWGKYFSFLISGDDLIRAKPNPDIYELACKKIDVDKLKILVVEDSYNGFLSATTAGLRCVLVGEKGILLNEVKLFLEDATK